MTGIYGNSWNTIYFINPIFGICIQWFALNYGSCLCFQIELSFVYLENAKVMHKYML